MYCVDYLNEIKSIEQLIDFVDCPHSKFISLFFVYITLDFGAEKFYFLQFAQYKWTDITSLTFNCYSSVFSTHA